MNRAEPPETRSANQTPNEKDIETESGTGTLLAPGRAVELHLEVRFQDGFVALSTFDAEPVACTVGDGTLTPALESTLLGLAPGSETYVVAHGSELFSPYDEANIHWMERGDFPSEIEPIPGLVVAFETPGGHETSGVVLGVEAERVQVDFNHPFAGRSLTIRVRVLSVAEPRSKRGPEA
jgi:FKBP-type peptidyl-prolyl cis-trans isomerase SlpA